MQFLKTLNWFIMQWLLFRIYVFFGIMIPRVFYAYMTPMKVHESVALFLSLNFEYFQQKNGLLNNWFSSSSLSCFTGFSVSKNLNINANSFQILCGTVFKESLICKLIIAHILKSICWKPFEIQNHGSQNRWTC